MHLILQTAKELGLDQLRVDKLANRVILSEVYQVHTPLVTVTEQEILTSELPPDTFLSNLLRQALDPGELPKKYLCLPRSSPSIKVGEGKLFLDVPGDTQWRFLGDGSTRTGEAHFSTVSSALRNGNLTQPCQAELRRLLRANEDAGTYIFLVASPGARPEHIYSQDGRAQAWCDVVLLLGDWVLDENGCLKQVKE